jgi:Fungal specific transcription factor domain
LEFHQPDLLHYEANDLADLSLLTRFILHTSKKMSLHPARVAMWQRVIPEIATKRKYLMHLLLALAGMHARFEYQASTPIDSNPTDYQNDACFVGNSSADVDLHRMIEHHQQGLEGIQEALCYVSSATAEDVLCGSILITAFAFGSLSISDLNKSIEPDESPSTEWLRLCRGLAGVVREHWATLKLGRLRSMLFYNHSNDDWKMYPALESLSGYPRLVQGSRALSIFAQGASRAISMLRTFSTTIYSSPAASSELSLSPSRNTEDSQLDRADEYDADYGNTIDKLEAIYMRILYVLRFTQSERDCHASLDIQIDLEDAAITSWPDMISDAFISSLKLEDEPGVANGFSFTILAHFYLTLILLEDLWYLNRGIRKEMHKIARLVRNLNDSSLSTLMQWPTAVMHEG